MRIRPLLPLILLSLLGAAQAQASSNPIPGVGIVVKRNPGSSTALVIPAGFFGAGSSAFSGTVSLEGRCSHDCGGCEPVCTSNPDSRLDYASSSLSGPLDLTMPPMTLRSSAPVSVSVAGSVRVLDVSVALSGQSPAVGAPVTGQLALVPGGVLDLGASALVLSSSLDLHCTVTFSDASTGASVGSSLEQDLHVSLQEAGIPITRQADGTPTGRIVLGQSGSSVVPCTFASSGGELVLKLFSLTSAPSVRASGLACAAVGGATFTSSADARRLPVHNLGSSGQDGVDVSLSRLSGHAISSSSHWSSLDAGAQIEYGWDCRLNGLPPGQPVFGRCALHLEPNAFTFTPDLSAFSSSSSMRCLAYLGGQLVLDSTCPSSTTLSLLVSAPSPLLPAVAFELDNARHAAAVSVSSSGLIFVFGGQSVACDRVVCVGDLDQDGSLDRCAVRCAVPAASSLHDIEFDSQSFVRAGHAMSLFDMDEDCDDLALHLTPSSVSSSSHFDVSSSLLSSVLAGACDNGSCGGGGGGAGGMLSVPLLPRLLLGAAPSLSIGRHTPFHIASSDDGLALECRVSGSSSCSATGVLASVRQHVQSGSIVWSTDFSGMCADQESVFVSRKGRIVSRSPVSSSSSIVVSATPGGPPGVDVCAMGTQPVTKASSNIQNNLVAPGTPSASTVVGPPGLSVHAEYLFDRVVCVDGTCTTGDEVTFTGQCASGQCGSSAITVIGCNFGLQRSGSSSGSSSSFDIADVVDGSLDVIRASVPSSVSISSTRPVVHVPVSFDRLDATPARGASVTIELSSNLVLASPPVQGAYFSRSGQTDFLVVPDAATRRYVVDTALLGPGCGPTDSGELFTVSVARAPGAPDGTGYVSVVACEAADCNAGALPASPGGRALIVLDSSTPAPLTGFAATQVTSGNDADGTTKVALVWSPRSNATVEVYRAAYGNYPEYDDAPNAGSVPPPPSSLPGGRWSPVSFQCSSSAGTLTTTCADEPSTRDFYYYVGVVRDAFGNVSPPTSMTTGTLNYHLGDVSNGLSSCAGDNLVGSPDVSFLGAHYGALLASGSSFACLDVGPTSTGRIDGRPLTDNRVSFADLILFAINYQLVSRPADAAVPSAASANLVSLRTPALPAAGSTFDVELFMEGAGDVLGLSTQLAWDAAVVEPVSVQRGELLGVQGRDAVVLSPQAGGVDAALLGAAGGIAGRGTLARITFRRKAEGDPAIRIASVTGKDVANRDVAIANTSGAGAGVARTALRLAFPNPFERSTNVVFALAKSGPAEVGVFDVAGRRVRRLLSGLQAAGEQSLAWDGRDDSGVRLSAGVYLLRLEAGGHRETRAIRLLH